MSIFPWKINEIFKMLIQKNSTWKNNKPEVKIKR